jgi:DNA polymerase III subunit epsilon
MYAILDIETTGGSPKNCRITEIAIYVHDGSKIIDEFATLINPEVIIPYFITNLTGISNEMVENAPRFFEVAKRIVEITDGKIIVGHNVGFDYGFIQNEFRQLGYDYNRKTLCTVKLSRKIIPGYRSYSLGKICESLGITINGRHRAAGDAFATVKLFEHLLQKSAESGQELPLNGLKTGRLRNLNEFLKPDDINKIPEESGVYYFHDSEGNLLYIGKSKNIHRRILDHLGNRNSRKAMQMCEKIAGITYELTGSELIALLKESQEIKTHKPFYNRKQKRTSYPLGLYQSKDQYGYILLKICKIGEENNTPIICFENKAEAVGQMTALVQQYWLCQKLCGLYDTDGQCFHYEIRQCNGACIQKEPVSVYNQRVEKLISGFGYENENLLIIDTGRSATERAVVCIEEGIYKGFGYLDISESYLGINDMKECIKPSSDNRDIRQIINNWMRKNKVEKVIRF